MCSQEGEYKNQQTPQSFNMKEKKKPLAKIRPISDTGSTMY
jgi:hypothetical protein